MLLEIVHDIAWRSPRFSRILGSLESSVRESSGGFVARAYVDILVQEFGESFLDCSSIYHYERPVVTEFSDVHWVVFVTELTD